MSQSCASRPPRSTTNRSSITASAKPISPTATGACLRLATINPRLNCPTMSMVEIFCFSTTHAGAPAALLSFSVFDTGGSAAVRNDAVADAITKTMACCRCPQLEQEFEVSAMRMTSGRVTVTCCLVQRRVVGRAEDLIIACGNVDGAGAGIRQLSAVPLETMAWIRRVTPSSRRGS